MLKCKSVTMQKIQQMNDVLFGVLFVWSQMHCVVTFLHLNIDGAVPPPPHCVHCIYYLSCVSYIHCMDNFAA